jgi:NAD-dependent oxidoreductase involved in siderophore biosynthesis
MSPSPNFGRSRRGRRTGSLHAHQKLHADQREAKTGVQRHLALVLKLVTHLIVRSPSDANASAPSSNLASTSALSSGRPPPSDLLIENHPNRAAWPAWMHAAVNILVNFQAKHQTNHSAWLDTVQKWLMFEHKMGYPEGQVS